MIPTLCHITTLRVKVIKKEVGHTPPSPPFLLAKKKKGKKKHGALKHHVLSCHTKTANLIVRIKRCKVDRLSDVRLFWV